MLQLITFILGIYAARFICKLKKYQGFIDGIITLPLVLPPTVVGFFLLLFLGKNSFIGQFLAVFDINIIFFLASYCNYSSCSFFPIDV